jgi:hypothetical protein
VRKFVHAAVQVTTEPTMICTIAQDIEQCLLRNVGDVVVYVGGEHVSGPDGDAMGFPLDPGQVLELKSFEFDSTMVWAVAQEVGTEAKTEAGRKRAAEKQCGTLVFLVSQ